MAMVLSREELREVTGCAQRAMQRQNLDAMGIPYVIRSDGWPVVDRRAYDKAMGIEAANDDSRGEFVMDLGRINE